jgi:predicted HAD superfamily phosphohydrolase YqeG
MMVGDQYFTDVAGANLAGVLSVKVNTYDRSSFTLPIRIFQRAELVLYRVLHK